MVSKVLVALAAMGVLVAASAYYLYSSNASSQSASNSVEVSIQIVGDGTDYYVPANVTVKLGQVVTFAVFNTDDNTHGLAIPAFNMDTGIIKHGITARFTFTADKVGTFPWDEPIGYCTGGNGNVCNSAQDLKGNLTVTP
jgi:plastocyanin